MTTSFKGFGEDGLLFLRQLALHNEKAWFEENKHRYEASLLEPAKHFVGALQEELHERGLGGVSAEPVVGGSFFRIRRDTRFSKDKAPYKTHFDLWLWEGESKKGRTDPGFFVRLSPDVIVIGAGRHTFEKEQLARYREAVDKKRSGEALSAAVLKVQAAGFTLRGETYKRLPRGYAEDHPRAALLKHSALYAFVEEAPPPALFSARFVAHVARLHERAAPLHRWLTEHVSG